MNPGVKVRNAASSLSLGVLMWLISAWPMMGQGHATKGPETEVRRASTEQQATWARLWEEHQGHKLLMRFSKELRPQALVIEGADVISMAGEAVLEDHSVVVDQGRFVAVGPRSEVSIPQGAKVIAQDGLYVIPGLTDAHSHTISSLSQFLVYVTQGVTTLREMDGYPWMLRARDRATADDFLIPHLYIAGHILSNRAMDFYMTQVDTVDQARRLVRAQAAAGYDFIKIHNSLPQPLFGAVFEAAGQAGLDVVGHIPNEIKIAEAVRAGMRTNEHFKGYLFDETLEITTQDYLSATRGADLWHTPTFTTYHDHLRGAASLELVSKEDSLELVPRWLRQRWLEQAKQPVDRLTALRQSIYPKSRQIFLALWPITDKFIAGTDTGTYAMMVPGFALQEEVRIFESLGLTPFQALKTATINPALAMRKAAEFGTIEVGKRADFVVLDANPLQGTEHLKDIFGVSLRGTWLPERVLEEIRTSLAAAFRDQNPVPVPSHKELEAFVVEMQALGKKGFPYPAYLLEEIEGFLSALGEGDLAAGIAKLRKE